MDEYSEFASDDFDVKGWINATVASHLVANPGATETGGTSGPPAATANSLDTHLSTVATKLQAVSASINAGLEKSMVEIMVSVPRVVTEVERVETAIKTLHAELGSLSGQLEEIDHGTNAHVETLARLDLVKTNMGDCLHTLTEAASWNALVREVNARFGQDDFKGVAERLEAMVGSMGVLKDMPEAEDRAATLRELQERLEALLKPKLLEVLKKDRAGPLAEYASMYRQLGQTEAFRGEYCKAKAAAAHRRWFTSSTSPSGETVRDNLVSWLPSFLEYLQGSLMDERKKASDLFGADKSPAVLCQLVVTAFQPLLGSFQKQLEAAAWPDAVGLLTEVLRFVGQALDLARGAGERDLLAVLLSATAAFRPLQDSFGSLEGRYLSMELQPLLEILGGVHDVRGEGVSRAMAFTRRMEEISDVSTKGFVVVQHAAGRCTELTAGYKARDLLKEAAEALCSFVKAVRDAAKETRSSGKVLDNDGVGEPGASTVGETEEFFSGMMGAFSEGGAGDFDWQFLGGALVLLGTAGRCQRCLAATEKEFASALLRQRTGLFASTPPRLSSLNETVVSSMSSSSNRVGSSSSNGGVVGGGGGDGEEGMVALLRSALARVRLEEDRAVRAEIRARLMALGDPSSALPGDVLPGPARDVRALASEACSLVFDVCFTPVRARLNSLTSLDSWREEAVSEGQGWGASGDEAWEYDTVPQVYMTQVGEHLLTLLQNLEPFANSEAFHDAAEPTQDLHVLTEPSWRECGVVLGLGESELILLETLSGAKPPEEGVGHPSYEDDHDHDEYGNEGGGSGGGVAGMGDEGGGEEAAKFCTAWLLCVASSTVGCLLTKVLSLSELSDRGVKHLEADLKYLANVFHALDLAAPPILEHLTLLAGFGREEAVNHLAQETTTGFGPAGVIMVKLERRLAEARGISLP